MGTGHTAFKDQQILGCGGDIPCFDYRAVSQIRIRGAIVVTQHFQISMKLAEATHVMASMRSRIDVLEAESEWNRGNARLCYHTSCSFHGPMIILNPTFLSKCDPCFGNRENKYERSLAGDYDGLGVSNPVN
jgi:hypothetical protein